MSETDGRVSRLTIDLAAIQRNYRRLQQETGPAFAGLIAQSASVEKVAQPRGV